MYKLRFSQALLQFQLLIVLDNLIGVGTYLQYNLSKSSQRRNENSEKIGVRRGRSFCRLPDFPRQHGDGGRARSRSASARPAWAAAAAADSDSALSNHRTPRTGTFTRGERASPAVFWRRRYGARAMK
jgi:hypothetical protein